MSNKITLFLDKCEYFAGNIIRGQAVCSFNLSEEVRKISITFKGKEQTHWTDADREWNIQIGAIKCTGCNDIIYKEQIVHGPGVLNAGRHVFPFEFSVPDELPDSFDHYYGYIVYSVNATVHRVRPMDFASRKGIRIKSPVRLERLSVKFKRPVEYSNEKIISSLCCANGIIQMDVSLQKRAFAVEEFAAIKVHIKNTSNVNVESLNTQITQEMGFAVTSPTIQYKSAIKLIASDYNSGVKVHGDKTYDIQLAIPPTVLIPNFNGCRLFICRYSLKIKAKLPRCHTDLDIVTELGLGHIPYPEVPHILIENASASPYGLSQSLTNFLEPSCCEPVPMPVPMSMPMPMLGWTSMPMELPPYPPALYPPCPSVTREDGAPSAPPKIDLDSGNEDSSFESPPPSYEEALDQFE